LASSVGHYICHILSGCGGGAELIRFFYGVILSRSAFFAKNRHCFMASLSPPAVGGRACGQARTIGGQGGKLHITPASHRSVRKSANSRKRGGSPYATKAECTPTEKNKRPPQHSDGKFFFAPTPPECRLRSKKKYSIGYKKKQYIFAFGKNPHNKKKSIYCSRLKRKQHLFYMLFASLTK